MGMRVGASQAFSTPVSQSVQPPPPPPPPPPSAATAAALNTSGPIGTVVNQYA